jgi:hypothetical protein
MGSRSDLLVGVGVGAFALAFSDLCLIEFNSERETECNDGTGEAIL